MVKLNSDMGSVFCLVEGVDSHMAKGMDVYLLGTEHMFGNNNKIHPMWLIKLKEWLHSSESGYALACYSSPAIHSLRQYI